MAGQGRMGSVSMQGYSHTSAPRERSFSERAPARSRGRVTRIRWPRRGRRSNQHSRGARAQTSPTTMTAGLRMPMAAERSGRVRNVASHRRWALVVPFSTAAAGVSGAMPAWSSPSARAGRAATPMRKTRVPPLRTRASKSMMRGLPERWWPVMMWTEEP